MPEKRTALRELDLEEHLNDPSKRQSYVTPMFDLIAPRYDDFTRLFSFGMDRGWKATLVQRAAEAIPRAGNVVDVASGTGDLAFALSQARKDLVISATDVSLEMLDRARDRRAQLQGAGMRLAGADLTSLPFRDGSVDAVTAGYALRNTPDWNHSLREIARVLRPGGQLFTLDFYQPSLAAWRLAFLTWLSAAGNVVGWWWHREPMAYGYIAYSIRHFTTVAGFSDALERSGFDVVRVEERLGGGIALHHAVRRR